jgi:hypothetical protein
MAFDLRFLSAVGSSVVDKELEVFASLRSDGGHEPSRRAGTRAARQGRPARKNITPNLSIQLKLVSLYCGAASI